MESMFTTKLPIYSIWNLENDHYFCEETSSFIDIERD